ncbi:MAG: hypothetical protein ACK5MD_10610 [Flavobacteriales bacterium]
MKSFRLFFLTVFCLLIFSLSYGQVGINTDNPDPSAALDIVASDKGLLIPRVSLTGANDTSTITTPANGLLVYNLQNAGTGDNEVLANNVYYFNRSINKWSLLVNKEVMVDQLDELKVPTLGNFIYKITAQRGLDKTANTINVVNFTSNASNFGENITFNGSTEFTINKTGYYNFNGFANWLLSSSTTAYWLVGIQVKTNSATSWTTTLDSTIRLGMRCMYVNDSAGNLTQPCNFSGAIRLVTGNVFRLVVLQTTVGTAVSGDASLEMKSENGVPYSAGFTTLFFPE